MNISVFFSDFFGVFVSVFVSVSLSVFCWSGCVWASQKLVDISVDSSSGRRRLGRHAQQSVVTFILNLFQTSSSPSSSSSRSFLGRHALLLTAMPFLSLSLCSVKLHENPALPTFKQVTMKAHIFAFNDENALQPLHGIG